MPHFSGNSTGAKNHIGLLGLLFLSVLAAGAISPDSLSFMTRQWSREEYSHSYLIPVIALFLIAQKVPALSSSPVRGSWLGVVLVLAMLALALLGELSALFTIVNYAYVFILIGLVIATIGVRPSWILAGPLGYLLFMVPLPNFLYFNLAQSLQLISSEIGVWVIRLFGISVFLEGNVIDLGVYKLQVIEACSGLRYLFPLAGFGFLVAYLYKGPWWHRTLVFVSTLPITVLMNSFRIGIIGILVEHFGIGMADGFLHYFEGWIIFIACLGVLFAELWLLHRSTGQSGSMLDRIDTGFPALRELSLRVTPGWLTLMPLLACCALLSGAVFANHSLANRAEITPTRSSFLQFPLLHKQWLGRESQIEKDVLTSLRLTDHLIADYRNPAYPMPVNLYIAYYASQRKGASVHSPKSCIPGGGWEIKSLETVNLEAGMNANRVVIQKGGNRQLVYYWFEQRGRHLTNEYLVKWYLFVDALRLQRTDGALVRLVVSVPEGKALSDADAELQQFLRDFYPLMGKFIPAG